jgi:hypothetical protein
MLFFPLEFSALLPALSIEICLFSIEVEDVFINGLENSYGRTQIKV